MAFSPRLCTSRRKAYEGQVNTILLSSDQIGFVAFAASLMEKVGNSIN